MMTTAVVPMLNHDERHSISMRVAILCKLASYCKSRCVGLSVMGLRRDARPQRSH